MKTRLKWTHTSIQTLAVLAALTHLPTAWAQSWSDLSSQDQSILRPLRMNWEDLSDEQKQGWIKRVPEIKAMPPENRKNAQTRMAEWGALSQQQRDEVQTRVKSSSKTSNPKERAKLWDSFVNH